MDGFGVFTWPNGQVFKGNYEKEKKQGQGQLRLADGTLIKGNWVDGRLEGQSDVIKNGQKTKIMWKNGV